jgi:hypothetical protein
MAHGDDSGPIAQEFRGNFQQGLSTLGGLGLFLLFLHAYSLGGGATFQIRRKRRKNYSQIG